MSVEARNARSYCVVSGKGGVGKTVITANLAAAFAVSGKRTLVVDADLGLANLDVILGLNPEQTLMDVIRGTAEIREAIVQTPGGFDLLPAGSGLVEGTILTSSTADTVRTVLAEVAPAYDTILFDAGAGIGEIVLLFACLAEEILLVVTPEPTAIMDAYATVKILATLHHKTDFGLIVNLTNPSSPMQNASSVARHLQQVVARFLETPENPAIRLKLVGSVPRDSAVPVAVSRRILLMDADPGAPSVLSIRQMAGALGV